MTYTLDESHTSRNFTPAAQVPAVFGYPRTVDYITIHHWGANGQQFGIVRDYLCTNTTPTSAHFVAMDGQVACIVSPLDAAWHAGNARGNAQSIGIECHPEATDGDYQTIGELVAWLRTQYGDVPLVPHNYWTSTACPGDYDLNRIDAIARGTSGAVTTAASTITPITEADMTPDELLNYPAWTGGPTISQALLDLHAWLSPIQREGQPDAPIRQEVANANSNIIFALSQIKALPAAVWNQNIGPGNAAGVLAHVDAKPATVLDPAAVAAAIPANIAAQVADELAKRLTNK
jgi:hypothetical protein